MHDGEVEHLELEVKQLDLEAQLDGCVCFQQNWRPP